MNPLLIPVTYRYTPGEFARWTRLYPDQAGTRQADHFPAHARDGSRARVDGHLWVWRAKANHWEFEQ